MSILKKRGIVTEYLPWLLIAVTILAILMIAIFVLRDSGFNLIDKLRGIVRGT